MFIQLVSNKEVAATQFSLLHVLHSQPLWSLSADSDRRVWTSLVAGLSAWRWTLYRRSTEPAHWMVLNEYGLGSIDASLSPRDKSSCEIGFYVLNPPHANKAALSLLCHWLIVGTWTLRPTFLYCIYSPHAATCFWCCGSLIITYYLQ